jgi:hypothetical protein
MYNAHRSRGSPPPPAAGEPPEAERSQRDRRQTENRLGSALSTVEGERLRRFESLVFSHFICTIIAI